MKYIIIILLSISVSGCFGEFATEDAYIGQLAGSAVASTMARAQARQAATAVQVGGRVSAAVLAFSGKRR